MNAELSPGARLGLSMAAGVVGSLVAFLIWSNPPVVLAIVVGLVLGAAAFIVADRYLLPGATGSAHPAGGTPPVPAHHAGGAPPVPAHHAGGAPPVPAHHAGGSHGVGPAAPRRPWAQASPGSVPAAAPALGPSPDLARFVRRELLKKPVRLPQCPRCGSFVVDGSLEAAVYTFTCQACEHSWRWAPGEPWPRVVIDPRIRLPRYRDYPEGEEPQT